MNSPIKHWRDTKKINKYLGVKGKLLVWTKVYTAPSGFEYQTPYFVGIVETQDEQSSSLNKKRIPVQIVDTRDEDLKIGLKVKLVVRRVRKPQANDVIEYGIKAVPEF